MPRHRLTAAETAERKARIVELRRQRRQFDAIGAEFDISAQRAHQIYQQALTERPNMQVDEHRSEEGELADLATRRLMALAVDPKTTDRIKIDAWVAMKGWAEHKANLFGLKAPTKHEVTTLDQLDRELAALDVELGALAAPETDRAPG